MVDAAHKIGETGQMVPAEKQPPDPVEVFSVRNSLMGKSELRATVTAGEPNDFRFDLDGTSPRNAPFALTCRDWRTNR